MQRTLENFAKCKDIEEFHKLCNSIDFCKGCEIAEHPNNIKQFCHGDGQIIFSKVKQIVRKKKLSRLLDKPLESVQ